MATVRGTTGTVLRGKRRHGRRQEASDLLERVRTQHVSPGPQPLRTRQAVGQILYGSLRSPGGSLQPDAVSDRSALQVPYQSSSPWRIDRHLRVGTPQTLRALRLRQSARYDDSRPASLWCRRRKNPEETTRGTKHNDAQASQHDCDWNGDGLPQHGSAANNSSSFEQRSERARDQAPTGTPRLHVREIKQPVHKPQPQPKEQHRTPAKMTPSNAAGRPQCSRCNAYSHKASECRFKEATCHSCGKTGHIAKACRSSAKPKRPLHQITDESDEYDVPVHVITHASRTAPITVTAEVQRQPIEMEVDTGASVSIMSQATYLSTWPDVNGRPILEPSRARLRTYTGAAIPTHGRIRVPVRLPSESTEPTLLPLVIVDGEGPTLLGRDWLHAVRLDWTNIHNLQTPGRDASPKQPRLQALLNEYDDLFSDELGTYTGPKAHIVVRDDAQPRFFKARPVPYAYRDNVCDELRRLEREKVIEPVQHSDWAAPVVPVVKDDGSIRLCGDYKLTVNRASQDDQYPLPNVEDMFATLTGGKTFTKLDLRHAYAQVPLDDTSKVYTTINTPLGLFRYNRMPFGVSSAPSCFQRIIEGTLQGIPHTLARVDDILVTGENDDEHLANLTAVLSRLRTAGLRLKRVNAVSWNQASPTWDSSSTQKGRIRRTKRCVRSRQHQPRRTRASSDHSWVS